MPHAKVNVCRHLLHRCYLRNVGDCPALEILQLVEEDLGREVAQDVAANLVMFFKRPVNQNHFIRDPSSCLALATFSASSPFVRRMGITPAAYKKIC